MYLQKKFKWLALLSVFFPLFMQAEAIEVKLSDNETFFFAVNEEDSIAMIKKNIAAITGYSLENHSLSVDISNEVQAKSYTGHRNYYEGATDSDRKELYFIMKTLALKSLLELAKYKSKLEKAGEHIDHLHPLNFLAEIFSDEELKAYLHAIKKRGSYIWDKFFHGLTTTLNEESKLNNMSLPFLVDFSSRLGIDIQIIQIAYEKRDWNEFVKLLIANIPRDGDADRYDM
jgi:hypothetical protein